MGGFGSRLDGGMRRLGLAAALAGAAMLLAPSWAIPEASAKPGSARSDLNLGPAGDGTGASGSVRFKPSRNGDRVRLRLRNLLPKTRYEIRDGLTGSVLAAVRSNRRGKVKASFRSDRLPNGSTLGLAGLPIEVCVAGTDDAVLEGQVPGDAQGKDDDCTPWTEFTYSTGTVSTDPDAAVQASLTLTSVSGEGLDTPLDSMSLFVSPGYFGGEGGDAAPPAIPGPVTLWIADGDGGLQQVASIEGDSYEIWYGSDGEDGSNLVCPDGGPSKDGSARKKGGTMGDRGDGTIGGDYATYFWYADNSGEGGLPFGASTVAELVGRSFEVRDAEGTVLLSGTLPTLEEVVFEDPFRDFVFETGSAETGWDDPIQASVSMTHWSDGTDEGTVDSIAVFVGTPWVWILGGDGAPAEPAAIPGPVTFSIADGEGALQTVATIDAFDWGDMPPPMDGNGGMTFSFAFPGGGDGWNPPPFYSWTADSQTGDGLPLGVGTVKDLVGRAFELRDGEGNLLFSGTLPELQAFDPYGPYPGDDPSNGVVFPDLRK